MIVVVRLSPRRVITVDTPDQPTAWSRVFGEGNHADGMVFSRGSIIAGPGDERQVMGATEAWARRKGQTITAVEWETRQS